MKNKSLLFFLTALMMGCGSYLFASGIAVSKGNEGDRPGKAQLQNHLKSGNAVSLNWQSLGPDNVGGRTRAILFDKRDATFNTVYAASVAGGIWKSTNLGSTWVKVNQANSNLNVSCMAQTDNNDIYAGTGEYGFSQGTGLYVSTDGDNFSLVPGTMPTMVDNVLEWAYINELAIQNGRIYAATNAGLKYRNSDESQWRTANYIDGEGQLQPLNSFVWDVKVGSNGIVVASIESKVYVSELGQPNGFINQSTKQVLPDTVLNPEKLPSIGLGRIELAVAPSNPDYIYACASDPYGYFDNIYRSIDKGITWEIIFPGHSSLLPDIFVVNNVAYGLVANTIVVYPNNPEEILVGGINMWHGKFINEGYYYWGTDAISSYATSKFSPLYLHELHHTYVFKPNDPKTFLIGTDGGISTNIDGELYFKSLNRTYMTSQFVTLNVNGFGNPIGGTLGNGIQYIGDGTNSPIGAVEVWNGDFNNSGEGGYVAISKINPKVFILSLKGGPFRRTEDKGFSFSTTFLNSGMSAPANTYCPMILWESFNDPTSMDSTRFKASKDITEGEEIIVRSQIYDYPFKTIAPHDIHKGDVVYFKDPLQAKTFLALGDKVYYTKEILDFTKEPEWWQVAKVVGTVSCMSLSADANHLYVGTESGNVFRISNLTHANSAATASITSATCVVATQQIKSFPNRIVTSIAVDPKNPQHILVTLGNYGFDEYVYNVTNALDSLPKFTSVQTNLPHGPVYSSLIELNNSNLIILGTEYGIFLTNNISAPNWVNDNGPMGRIPVKVLLQQTVNGGGIFVPSDDPNIPGVYYPEITNYGVIYAATYGRGVYSSNFFVGIDEPNIDTPPTNAQLAIYPNPVRNELSFTLKGDYASEVFIEIYDFSGRKSKENHLKIQPGSNTFTMDVSNLKRGTYILRCISDTSISTGKFIIVK